MIDDYDMGSFDTITFRLLGSEHPMYEPTVAVVVEAYSEDPITDDDFARLLLPPVNAIPENYDLQIKKVYANWGADASAVEAVLMVVGNVLLGAAGSAIMESIKAFRDDSPYPPQPDNPPDLSLWARAMTGRAFGLGLDVRDRLVEGPSVTGGEQITFVFSDSATGWTYTVPTTPMQRSGLDPLIVHRTHESGSNVEREW